MQYWTSDKSMVCPGAPIKEKKVVDVVPDFQEERVCPGAPMKKKVVDVVPDFQEERGCVTPPRVHKERVCPPRPERGNWELYFYDDAYLPRYAPRLANF